MNEVVHDNMSRDKAKTRSGISLNNPTDAYLNIERKQGFTADDTHSFIKQAPSQSPYAQQNMSKNSETISPEIENAQKKGYPDQKIRKSEK